MKDFSYITNSHPSYIENLYKDFASNPESIDPEMRKFFEGFDFAVSKASTTNGAAAKPAEHAAANQLEAKQVDQKEIDGQKLEKEFSVYHLIQAYRKRGHLIAKTNPIRERKDRRANLQLDNFRLTQDDLNTNFVSGEFIGLPNASLKDILAHLEKCYTSSIGIEFTYINDPGCIDWLLKEIEGEMLKPLSSSEKRCILEKLNQGVIFEKFLHTKYVGQKRFSLEGGETTIAALDAIINTAAEMRLRK